ncbi:MAG: nitroreductase family protein [Desulfobacteraceae bacterium]|nr:nitroreductase family protein [Desulfobacteraceae bacterium]
MQFIEIDRDSCKRDGICSAVCPAELIGIDPDGFPVAAPDAAAQCINCGHCVAACPTAALSHQKVPLIDCLPIREDLMISTAAATQFLKMRRSVREFKEETVSRELLAKIIDTTRFANSAVNYQPVRWVVVRRPDDVRQLAGLAAEALRKQPNEFFERYVKAWDMGRDLILRGAPHLIAAYASTEYTWAAVDSAIALAYLELAAQANGLGTTWAGLLTIAAQSSPAIMEFLDIPKDKKLLGAVMLGYPKYKYRRIPGRNEAVIKWR